MISERYKLLAERVELFHGLDPEEVSKIFARGRTMNLPKGDVLFKEGAVGSQMFVVLGGKIALYRRQQHLADLATGEMLGEMALVSEEPRSATAVAAEDSQVFILDETTFDKLMTKRVAIRILMNIVKTLSRRLKTTSEKASTH